jgi:hypothetical protein
MWRNMLRFITVNLENRRLVKSQCFPPLETNGCCLAAESGKYANVQMIILQPILSLSPDRLRGAQHSRRHVNPAS